MSMDDRKNCGNERLDVFWESLIAGVDACSSLDASLCQGSSDADWPLRPCPAFRICLPHYTRIWCEYL